MKKVSCFIDGYNLFHALKLNHHQWLDLNKLARRLVAPKSESICAIFYFSAHAMWRPAHHRNHTEYIAALESGGVEVVLGHFKTRDGVCKRCNHQWKRHEEKETDVNIALFMLNEAYKCSYDKAMLITRDSDLAPALRMIRKEFPCLEIEVVSPPYLGHSTELIRLATSKRKIHIRQVENCLFPRLVKDPNSGAIVATRPVAYDPPQ